MRWERLLFIYISALWVLAVLLSCYTFGPLAGTETSAYHARMTELFSRELFPQYDPLSYGGRAFTYYPLGYFLAGLVVRLTGAELFYLLFPAATFSAYLALAYLLHRRFADRWASMAVVLLIITTAYGAFGRYFIHQLTYIFALASAYLSLRERYLGAGVLAGMAALSHAESFLFLVLFLGALSTAKKRALLPLLTGAALAAPYYLHLLASNSWYLPLADPEYRAVLLGYWDDVKPGVENLIKLRYLLFLGAGGALAFSRHRAFMVMVLSGSALVYMGSRFISPLGLLLFSLPAAALLSEFRLRRYLFLGAAIYSLLYLGYAVSSPLQAQTDPSLLETLEWIKHSTPGNTTVVASIKEGHLITYYAERKNFADGLFEFADLRKARLSLAAFSGNTSALEELLALPEPRVFLVRKSSPAYGYLKERLEVLHEAGNYAVLG